MAELAINRRIRQVDLWYLEINTINQYLKKVKQEKSSVYGWLFLYFSGFFVSFCLQFDDFQLIGTILF